MFYVQDISQGYLYVAPPHTISITWEMVNIKSTAIMILCFNKNNNQLVSTDSTLLNLTQPYSTLLNLTSDNALSRFSFATL